MSLFSKPLVCGAAILAALLSLSGAASAQETTTTTATPKSATRLVTIDTAQVIYVSGDDVVVKLPNGALRLLALRPGTTLTVDGKATKPADLTPGTALAHVRVNTRVESNVTSVAQVNGTIVAKNGQFLTLRLDDGTAKIYRVPAQATFTVNGNTTSYNEVTKGMKINATAVKTSGLSTEASGSAVVGQTPVQSGILLIER